jgi:hypothetical protein
VFDGKTLDEMWEKKMMRRRKLVMKKLGFFPSQRTLFISNLSWASTKLQVQINLRAFYILPRAGNKAAITYKGHGKDTCKVIRIKSNVDE